MALGDLELVYRTRSETANTLTRKQRVYTKGALGNTSLWVTHTASV
jgi:hypothetical protein